MKSEPPFYVQNLKIGKVKTQMSKTTMERIAEAQEKINRDENKLKLLMRQQKEEERKARTNRICKRGGLLEKLLPDTINLTDGQFEAFAKRTLLTDFTRRALAAAVAETADPQGKADTARGGEKPAGVSRNPCKWNNLTKIWEY
ncbi:MAG: DUF3847 domain-containing protein [Clostridiales bacterium]|jgi:hypothetical protein|nr:DUF3847 domain-containing protein [Clostridiales bacterium]